MAGVIAPNAGSTYTTAGSIPNTPGQPVWLGLATPLSSSGCVVWYKGASPTSGSELLVINASPGTREVYGPFFIPGGVSTCSITGGSALAYVQF